MKLPTTARWVSLMVVIPLLISFVFLFILENELRECYRMYDKHEASLNELTQIQAEAAQLANLATFVLKPLADERLLTKGEFESIYERLRSFSKIVRLHERKGHLKNLAGKALVVHRQLAELIRKSEPILGPDSKVPADDRMKYVRPDFFKVMAAGQQVNRMALDLERTLYSPENFEKLNRRGDVVGFVLLAMMAANILVAIGLAVWFSRDTVSRLKLLGKKAELIAIGKELPARIDGTDEIRELDSALHEAASILTQTRRRERAVLDLATEVLFSLDKRMRFVSAGEATLKSWGYTPNELSGRTFADIVDSKHRKSVIETLNKVLSEPQLEVKSFETVIVGKDGRHVDCMTTPASDANRENIVCVALDITERKRIERLKQRFVSIVSHDLRTPLASIAGSLSMISMGARGELEGPSLERVQRCEDSVSRLMTLIEDLLAMERLESGKFPINARCVSTHDVCEIAIETVQDFAAARNIKLIKNYGDMLVLADEKRLVQVLINLLGNAIKFSPEETSVRVTTKSIEDSVEISVSDEGPGIAVEEQSAIFDRFYCRGDAMHRPSDPAPVKGTGLGLAIAKAIVDAHVGKIGVVSEPGKGSRFWFQIPAFKDGGGDENI